MTMLPFGDVAPIQRRVVAYVIDALIAAIIPVIGTVVAIVMTVTALGGDDPAAGVLVLTFVVIPVVGVLMLAWLIVYTVMQAGSGSIGMRAQGIRLANASDGAPIGFGRALLRNVIWGLAASIVVGYFSVLFDGSGRFQGWHDKVAGAVMLDARTASGNAAQAVSTQVPAAPARAQVDGAPSAMPGFAAPAAATSMPGFTPNPQGFPPPPSVLAQPGSGFAVRPPEPPEPIALAAPAGPSLSHEAADDEFVEHTVISPRIHRDLPDDPLISFVPGITQEPPQRSGDADQVAAEPVAPAPPLPETAASAPVVPPRPPLPAALPDFPTPPVTHAKPTPPAAADLDDVDDVDDIESTRISVPGHRLVFTWDDGQRATVSGRTVFGRNPEEGSGATNVAVRDETRSLSKTHFEAGATTRGGWVMDRQSTNGTVVVREGVRIDCPPGQRVPVRLGDSLEIGDRIVTIGGYV